MSSKLGSSSICSASGAGAVTGVMSSSINPELEDSGSTSGASSMRGLSNTGGPSSSILTSSTTGRDETAGRGKRMTFFFSALTMISAKRSGGGGRASDEGSGANE